MYYVYDFANGWSYPFETKEELALWWRERDHNFNELNVTGNDIFVNHWYKPILVGEVYFYISTPERYLRRFQVLDDDGRSIDIRLWPKFVWEWQKPYKSRYWGWSGSKKHGHRHSGPALWRGTRRSASISASDWDLIEEALPCPVMDRTAIRKKVLDIDPYDCIEKRCCCSKSKSWKDQCKARKQWAKQKPQKTTRPCQVSESGEELATRLMSELCEV